MISYHFKEDKWEQIQKDNYRSLMNTKCKGQSYGLEILHALTKVNL